MRKLICCFLLLLCACSKEETPVITGEASAYAMHGDEMVTVQVAVEEGLITSIEIDESFEDTTKKTLGYDYGMIAASSIQKEWFEQIEYLEEKLIGTDGTLLLNEDGTAQDADIVSGCTLPLDSIAQAIQSAVEKINEQQPGLSKILVFLCIRLVLGYLTRNRCHEDILQCEDNTSERSMKMSNVRRRGRNFDTRPLAMAYVRNQSWRRIYKVDVALSRGTLFNELDMPFSGTGRGGRNCECK